MPRYGQASISFGPPLTRMVKYLVIVTSAVFLLTYPQTPIREWAFDYFSLRPYDLTHLVPLIPGVSLPLIWEPVTYLFLHGGLWHVILNLLFLWMFGSDLEQLWGPRRFLYYFFLTGIGAGIVDVLLRVVLQSNVKVPTVGNSGAVYGILLAYGILFPDRPIFLWLVIPVKAKWFVLGMGVIEFLSSINPAETSVSHFAHLGGMLFGFLYLRGSRIPSQWQLRYQEWRRARLRRKFELYMRHQDKRKDDAGRWIN